MPRRLSAALQISSILLLACLSLGQPARAGDDPLAGLERQQRELFERIAPSVVCIANGDRLGSGFAVDDDGTVLTNAHVVGKQKRVKYVLYDGRSGTAPVIERATDDVDLALIKLPHEDVPPVALAEADDLRVGDWVASIGHGHGGIWTYNTGMVANIYPDGAEHPVFQTQIPLNPGASGGPIFDRLGRIVGVVVAGDVDANNVNFGLKIDVARRSLHWIGGGWRPEVAYERRRLWFGNADVPRWSACYQGPYRRKVGDEAFYEIVGRSDLLEQYERNHRAKVVLLLAGPGIGAPLFLIGLGIVADTRASYDDWLLGDPSEPDPETAQDGAVLMVIGGSVWATLQLVGALANPHPISASEARDLAEDYNRQLREELQPATGLLDRSAPVRRPHLTIRLAIGTSSIGLTARF